VSLTALKGLVHTLSVFLLSKDLFTNCQSYSFQRTCSQFVSLTAFKGLVHTLSVLLLSKDLFTHWKWARSTLNTFGSSPYVWFFQLSYTRNCIHFGRTSKSGHYNLSPIISQYCPVGWTSHQTQIPIGPVCHGPLILEIAHHPGALPKT
jgi:hypothetical protein